MMSQPNFCGGCGASLPAPPSRFKEKTRVWILGRFCPECNELLAGRLWHPWLMGLAIGFVCGLGVSLWRSSVAAPPPPLPKLTASPVTKPNGAPSAPSVEEPMHQCGARTKSGRPCRRKVRAATGYCWQHKDQEPKKKPG